MGGVKEETHPPHLVRIRHLRTGRLLLHGGGADTPDAVALSPSRQHAPNALFGVDFAATGPDAVSLHAATETEIGEDALGSLCPVPDSAEVHMGAKGEAAFQFLVTPSARVPGLLLRPSDKDAKSCSYLAGDHGRGTVALRARAEAGPAQWTLSVAAGGRGSARRTRVRVQAGRNGQFLACSPGENVRCARGRDEGWDVFEIREEAAGGGGTLYDVTGKPLVLAEDMSGLCAGGADGEAERIVVAEVAEGDGVDDDRVSLRSSKGLLSVTRGGEIRLLDQERAGKNEQFALRLALPSMYDHTTPRKHLRHKEGGLRVIEGSVSVPVDAKIAYRVITDYEGFASFIQDAAESEILERKTDTELRVRMVQSHSFLVLTLNLGMELEVHEFPEKGHVTMEMKKGFGVREYRGKWTATATGDGSCVLGVEIASAPSLPAPGFLIDGVISHATSETLRQVRDECIRRGAAAEKLNGSA